MAIRKISEFVEASSPQNSDKLLIERNGSGKSITVENLLNDLVTRTHVNLLRPTLVTTGLNGVTATSNRDGTYTLNGTATGDTRFFVQTTALNKYKDKKMVGCPGSGSADSYSYIIDYLNDNSEYQTSNVDSGDGLIIADYPKITLYFFIKGGTTLNNVVFKPMITDDLSATYDDYIPFDNSFIKGANIGLAMDLLWQNASIASPFLPQSFFYDLHKYKLIYMIFRRYTGDNNLLRASALFRVGEGAQAISEYGGDVIRREIPYSDINGITFGGGSSLKGGDDSNYMIPIFIYGVLE